MERYKDDWEQKAEQNKKSLESYIEDLKLESAGFLGINYKEFWTKAKEISSLFKTLRPLKREEREELWHKFSSLCDEIKRKQEKERDKKLENSKQKKSLIESKIKEAYYAAKGANSISDLQRSKELLNEALGWMKNGWGGFNIPTQLVESAVGGEGILTKEDRDVCWQKWKEANETVKYRREELSRQNYEHFKSRAYGTLNSAEYDDPKDAKSKIRDVQQEMKGTFMSRDQFQDVHNILDTAWKKACDRQQKAYEERQTRHKEWADHMQKNIERWSELIQKNEDVISKIESQIDKCQEMEQNASSSDFASTVRGWIEEKYQKIEQIRDTNRSLEEKIRSVRDKLC